MGRGSWAGLPSHQKGDQGEQWHKDQSLRYEVLRLAGDDERGGFGGDGIVGAGGCDLSGDGNSGLAEDVDDLGFLQSRGVVFKRQTILRLIDTEAAQAVGIGKFTEAGQLFGGQRSLQLVGHFE
jgi:hypothetical protein